MIGHLTIHVPTAINIAAGVWVGMMAYTLTMWVLRIIKATIHKVTK